MLISAKNSKEEGHRQWELFIIPIPNHLKWHGEIKISNEWLKLRPSPRHFLQVFASKKDKPLKKTGKKRKMPKASFPTDDDDESYPAPIGRFLNIFSKITNN